MNKRNKIFSLLITFVLLFSMSSSVIANEQQLTIEIEHLVLERQGDNIISVMDMVALKNTSNEDIISNIENPAIRIAIPEHVIHLTVGMQGTELPHAVVDNEVVVDYEIPAERSMDFAINYFLSIDSEEMDFSIIRDYPIKTLNIYVPANAGFVIDSPHLTDAGAMSIEQRTYNFYTISSVEAGQVVEATLIKRQSNQSIVTNDRIDQGYDGFHNPGHIRFWEGSPFAAMEPHLFTLIVVIIIGFAIGNYFYRWHVDDKKLKEQKKSQDDDIFIRLYKEEAVLKKKLAELQIKLDNNEIDEEEFTKRKDIFKKKLINVKLKIKEFTE
ncbi:hypothetical protein [Desulfuribacillus alkaliarsenatis]|uniref:SHOCT domain-containing protein n=1 Tax=Desulfuribacillus alkaliarsenatis TaxID=766136 RepID=A0A1E5G023_9FIRM|nr:hypothetical protein [Desulfuribacillus alkaliarsenatis]OEF96093.1 hypothetical protein BHF68_10185 [Desulfuribacillus alkaliarsenatis]